MADSTVFFEIAVIDGHQFQFSWSNDGRSYQVLTGGDTYLDGGYLPPWDRAVRVAMTAKSPTNEAAVIHSFNLFHK